MSGDIRKLPRRRKWRVRWGGRITAKATTHQKAEAQLRLLQDTERSSAKSVS